MLVDVLHGESTKRMLDAKLNMISQFGELSSFSKEELYAMITWLITNGYISKTKDSILSCIRYIMEYIMLR